MKQKGYLLVSLLTIICNLRFSMFPQTVEQWTKGAFVLMVLYGWPRKLPRLGVESNKGTPQTIESFQPL